MRWLLFIVVLVGCNSAERHLARARRQIAKAEAAGATWSHDTVYKNVTTIVPSVSHDSVYDYRYVRDTLTIRSERLVVKVHVDTVHKKVFVYGECAADTIIKQVPVVVTNTIESKEKTLPWWWIVFLIAGILVATIIKNIIHLFK